MTDEGAVNRDSLAELTTEIVAAYCGNNTVISGDIAGIIQSVHASLTSLAANATAAQGKLKPAVPIKKSVTPGYLVCLEDGKKAKMLKRHLSTAHGMTPAEYREKWGLRADYPMVAPNYAKQRSRIAKKIGLGTKPRKRTKKR